jgi:hypothetical protein
MTSKWFLHECRGDIVRKEETEDGWFEIEKCNTCGKEWVAVIIPKFVLKYLKIDLSLPIEEKKDATSGTQGEVSPNQDVGTGSRGGE